MFRRDHSFDPRGLIVLGTFFLALAVMSLRRLHAAWLPEDAADAIRGLLMGAGIGCNGLAVWMLQRRRANPPA